MKKATKRLLAVLLALLLIGGVLAGCGSKSAPEGEIYYNDSAAEEELMAEDCCPEEPESAPMPEPQEDMAGGLTTAPGGAADDAGAQNVPEGQKIIYTGDLTVETTEFDAAAAAAEKLAAEFGGFVESSEQSGNTIHDDSGATRVVDRSAYYVLRVPADRFTEAMERAGGLGNVIHSSRHGDNITSQFIDQEARRDSLVLQRDRLMEMMEKAEDVDVLVTLEARLSEVIYEIESVERQLRNWQSMVDYSTINLSLSEVEVYTPTVPVQRTFGEKIGDAFSDGWEGFGRGMQNFLIWLTEALPVILLLAVIAGGVVWIVLGVRHHKKKKRQEKAPEEKKDSEG